MLKRSSLVIALLLVFAMVFPVFAQDAEAEPFELTLIHVNDIHAHHQPHSDGHGGAARQATVVNQIRAERENTLLLDAGDRFTGTMFHILHLGQDSAQLINQLGFDVFTLGNHEFDNGGEVLGQFIDALGDIPVLTANIDFGENPDLAGKVHPYTILEVAGEQIGVIGIVAPDTGILSAPPKDIVFSDDLVNITQAAVDELTEAGVNKIILLSHVGYSVDVMLAQAVSGVDVVVGGHSHTLLGNAHAASEGEYPTVLESANGETVLVVQAGSNTRYVGELNVTFDADGLLTDWAGDTIFLSKFITPDPDVVALVEELAEPLAELNATPVGEAAFFLEGDRTVCRVEECLMGNLVADAMRLDAGADIAFINSGGVRASIDAGEITLGEVLTVQPFGNLLSNLSLTGADVIAALENGVSQLRLNDAGQVSRTDLAGRFLQVSGIKVVIDPTQEPGSRIVSVDVLNDAGEYEPIDTEAVYTIATLNFIRTGGDGFSVLAENAIDPYDFGRVDFDVTNEYIIENSPVAPELEGRITYVNAEVEPRP